MAGWYGVQDAFLPPSSFNLKGTGEEAWISGVPGGWAGYELFVSK